MVAVANKWKGALWLLTGGIAHCRKLGERGVVQRLRFSMSTRANWRRTGTVNIDNGLRGERKMVAINRLWWRSCHE